MKWLDMKWLGMLHMFRRPDDGTEDVTVSETPAKGRTPEEAKARRKAYRKRKAAKAARRRNRK